MKKPVMRRCIGCMQSKEKSELVRIVSYDDTIRLDPTGKAKGRGAYLCPKKECLDKALKNRGLARSFRRNVDPAVMETIGEELLALGKND